MTTIDARFNYNSVPYNIIDKNNANNRQALQPSYQYKKKKVIWLNTFYASSSINANNIYYEFTFNIPLLQIYENTRLRVISYVSNENNARPLIIKLKNLLVDSNSTYSNDNSDPILYISHAGATGMLLNNQYVLNLLPQNVDSIIIKVDDSFIEKDKGFNISSTGIGHFIIGLLFENDDMIIDNTASTYK